MRRHRKAPSAGPTKAARSSGGLLARLSLALLATALAAMAFSAIAAATPILSGSFTCSATNKCTGSPSEEAMTPGRLAVDEASGDVYVIDSAHDVINRFNSAGVYQSSILPTATAPGTFAFTTYDDIAVDNSTDPTTKGRVYVSSETDAKVFAFKSPTEAPANGFLWESSVAGVCGVSVDFTGKVYGTEFEAGVQQLKTTEGAPEGSPIVTTHETCETAFDPQGNVYTWEYNKVQVFKRAQPTFAVSTEITPGLAGLDPGVGSDVAINRLSNNVYVPRESGIAVYDSNAAETELESFGSAEIGAGSALGVTVDGDAHKIYVSDPGNADVHAYTIPFHTLTVTPSGLTSGKVSADSGAISECSTAGGTCSDSYEEGTVTLTATPAANSKVSWGPACASAFGNTCTVELDADKTVTVGFVAEKPVTITTAGATAIAQHTATVAGSVNPKGNPVSACEFEYGKTSAYGAKAPCLPSPGSGTSAAAVAAALGGLDPATTYHFRVVATNSGGTTNGADQSFTTLADTCATNTTLCPPSDNGGGNNNNGGGGSADNGGGSTQTEPKPKPKPLKCKKGFKKKTVKGKARCVKVKKKTKKSH